MERISKPSPPFVKMKSGSPHTDKEHVRYISVAFFALGTLLATALPASAQGFGLGGRFAWVRQDVDVDADSVRFWGLHLRAMGGRSGFELSFDRHTEEFDLINQKVSETPIQASLIMKLAGGGFAPYLLGGPGWYKRSIEPIDGPEDSGESNTEFGWHAGGGIEILAGRHIGIHGDYRYTFLGDGDDEGGGSIPIVGGLLPGYKGSMWTLGATIYF
jgi:opacity protein-like surface antigen